MRQTFSLIVHNTGRSISDEGWKHLDVEFLKFWAAATVQLRGHSLTFSNDRKFYVEFDWTPLVRRHKQHYSAMKRLHRNLEGPGHPWAGVKFPRKPSAIKISVDTKKSLAKLADDVAAVVVHDCFLIANIAAPGSFDLYRASITGGDYAPSVSLSNHLFEQSLYASKGLPLTADLLPADTVIKWYRSVRTSSSLLPQNPAEKALAALLQIASQDLSPATIIWLFYALESLLQTKPGENRSTLVRRIALLLDLQPEAVSALRKKFNLLYDLRSSIVHGGLEILHPVHNEQLDPRTDEKYGDLLVSADLGCSILIQCLQRLVKLRWRWPQFVEGMSGDTF